MVNETSENRRDEEEEPISESPQTKRQREKRAEKGGGGSSSGKSGWSGEDSDAENSPSKRQRPTENKDDATPGSDDEYGAAENALMSAHEDDEDEEDDEGEPAPQHKERTTDAGVITQIRAQNFMCHHNLTIDLHRRVNFINGSNGAGKSAILAALQICLGARATVTGRAKSLGGLVRHGHDGDALVQVTLLNSDDGFEYDKYGDSITVRRTIKRAGGGGKLELIGEGGEVLSRDRKDLEKMLDHLNIQVDNPCAVLDQENAKKFLQGSERDKYHFFMKATDLDRIIRDSQETRRQIDAMCESARVGEGRLEGYRLKVMELTEQLKAFEDLAKVERLIATLKARFIWSKYEQVEEAESNAKQEVERVESKLAKMSSKMTEFEANVEAVKAELGQLKDAMATAQEATKEAKKAANDAHRVLSDAKKPLVVNMTNAEDTKRELTAKKRERASLESKLDKLKREALRRAAGTEQQRVATELQQKEAALAKMAQQEPALMDQEMSLNESLPQLEAAARDAKSRADGLRMELRQQKELLAGVSGAGADPLALLGRNIPLLVREIRQATAQGRFHAEVAGPIGALVKVKEEFRRFQPMVEFNIGGLKTTFVVQDPRDKTTLQQMMRRAQCHAGIIIQSPHARYQAPQMPRGWVTVADCLAVESAVVWNVLLDQAKSERELCFADRKEAEDALFAGQRPGGLHLPHAVKEALFAIGDRNCGLVSAKNGNIFSRTNLLNPRERPFLGVDSAEQQRHLQRIVADLQEEVNAGQGDEMAAGNAWRQAQHQQKQAQGQLDQLLRHRREIENQLERLRRTLQDMQSESTTVDSSAAVEAELETCLAETLELEEQLAAVVVEREQLQAGLRPLEEAAKSARERFDALHRQNEGRGESYQEAQDKKRRAEHSLVRAHDMRKELEVDVAAARRMREDAAAKTTAMLAQVETFMRSQSKDKEKEWDGRRVRADGTPDQLERKVKAEEARLERERASRRLATRTEFEAREKLAAAKKEYKDKKGDVEKLKENAKLLLAEQEARTKNWLRLRRYISRKTTTLFDQYLNKKGSAGEVKFDNEHRTLSLSVQKNNEDESTQTDNVKQLSGGERSYATLALLLSLGSCHECPFRVMDEFDVFMDAVARRTAMKELIAYAEDLPQRQFIFITPQSLSGLPRSDFIKVHRMQDARPAGQTAMEDFLQRS